MKDIRSRITEMEIMIPLRNPGIFSYFLSNLFQYTEKFVFVILKGMLLCYKVHMSKMIFWETHQFGNIEHFLSSPTYLENHGTHRASWTTFSSFLLRTVVTIQWFHDSEVFWQSVPLTSFMQKMWLSFNKLLLSITNFWKAKNQLINFCLLKFKMLNDFFYWYVYC